MDTQMRTYGNLALAPLQQDAPLFTVVEGGLKCGNRSLGTASTPKYADSSVTPKSLGSNVCAAPRANRRHATYSGTRGSRLTYILSLAALLFACAAFSYSIDTVRGAQYDQMVNSANRETIEVSAGESLWSLAEAHPIDGMSAADTVRVIQDWNNLEGGLIRAGMELSVPRAS
ncbi:MAG: LysM peptidoglycan-binding domain-containing protein [Coriobacteriaceae bacterium]|nr:LysM peptidoglycan-binding domain-containing protein [Coriobacteriaceae bacterium]